MGGKQIYEAEVELDAVEEDFSLPLLALSVLDSVLDSVFASALDSDVECEPFSPLTAPPSLPLRA